MEAAERQRHIEMVRKHIHGKFNDVLDELIECSNRKIFSPSTLTKAIYEIECLRERLAKIRDGTAELLAADDRYPEEK